MTTLEVSFIFKGTLGSSENWLKHKIDQPSANLACLNWSNTVPKNINFYTMFEGLFFSLDVWSNDLDKSFITSSCL
jgi:hypothetical protein